jgi:hypothetical protein
MAPTRASLRTIAATVTLATLVASVHAQGPLARTDLLPGAWETTTPDGGVHGLWIEINTSQLKKKETTTQGISTEIYHRQGGQQTGASTREKNGGKGSAINAMLGAVLIVLIRQSIRTLHFDQNYEWIIIGCAVIVAVVLDQASARFGAKRLAQMAGVRT